MLLEGDAGGAMGGNLSGAGKALYEKAMMEWVLRFDSSRAAGSCYAGLRVGGTGAGTGALRDKGASEAGAASAAGAYTRPLFGSR